MNDIYNRIDNLCEKKGINITKMCKEAEVPRGNLTDLKMGRQKGLSAKNTAKIAKYFGVSVDYLINGTRGQSTTSFTNGILAHEAATQEEIQRILSELEPDTFDIAYIGNCIAITVDRDGGAAKEQIDQVIALYQPKEQKEKPTPKGELENAICQRLRDLESEELEDVNAYIDFLLSKRK